MSQNTPPANTQPLNGAIARYLASAPSLSNEDFMALLVDISGNLMQTMATLLAGEDTVNNVQKVEQRFSYQNITGDATTTVKSGAGFLHSITFNKPVATEVITIYDNTTNSSPVIATITIPASPMPVTLTYDVTFSTGLTIVTATAASDITVSYR